jgi:hypothetical protein
MEDGRFDALARAWGTPTGRRVVTKTLLGRALAGLGLTLGLGAETAAEQGKTRKGKTKHGRAGRQHGGDGNGVAAERKRHKKHKHRPAPVSPPVPPPASAPPASGCPGGTTSCGGVCANLQIDPANCGNCGNACGSGESCQGGQCVTPTCGANELLCGGTCVPSAGDHPCCSQTDCGGPTGSSNQIFCDESQHQCRCLTSGYGICLRTADRRGICGECCAGGRGSLNCQGDLGCNGLNFCTCAAGRTQCPGGNNRCYQDPPNADGTLDDPTVCALHGTTGCKDCTDGGKKPYVCCWLGDCVDASGYEPNTGGSLGTFCGGCVKCPENKICCNVPGIGPGCKDPVNGGFCPLPGE